MHAAEIAPVSVLSSRVGAAYWLAVGVAALMITALFGFPQADATYPGTDGRIAFVRANQIYTINPNGSGLTQLTTAGKNYRPEWSPDGLRIAYVQETPAGAKDVWVMSADGSGKRQVTNVGNVTAAPTWSAAGTRLAFARGRNPQYATLYTIRAAATLGTPRKMLGYYTGCECAPPDPGHPHTINVDRFLAWSPDGSSIALYNHEDGHLDDTIYRYDVATGEAEQINAVGGDCCGNANWSDLAWTPAGGLGFVEVDLGADGQSPAPSRVVLDGFGSLRHDKSFAPSPSGTRVALTNDRSGTSQLVVARRDGTGRRQLTTGYQPDWQAAP